MHLGRLFIIILGKLAVGAVLLEAGTLFRDTFASESGGKPTTNYRNFANWVITRGSVDLIGNSRSVAVADYYPGNNLYVDLDGSDIEAGPGRMETKAPLSLAPGAYELEFDLGGNSSGGDENRITVSFGKLFKEEFVRANILPPGKFEHVLRNIVVTEPVSARLVFDAAGPSDYYGLIIDNVRIGRVEPFPTFSATLVAVALAGAAGVVVLRRRRGNGASRDH